MEATKILVQELKFCNGRRKDGSVFMKPLLGEALPSAATTLTSKGGKFGKIAFYFMDWLEF
jgi:hypothetical protein